MKKLLLLIGVGMGIYHVNKKTKSTQYSNDFVIFPGYKVSCKSIVITDQKKADDYAFILGKNIYNTEKNNLKNIEVLVKKISNGLLGNKSDCLIDNEKNLKTIRKLILTCLAGLFINSEFEENIFNMIYELDSDEKIYFVDVLKRYIGFIKKPGYDIISQYIIIYNHKNARNYVRDMSLKDKSDEEFMKDVYDTGKFILFQKYDELAFAADLESIENASDSEVISGIDNLNKKWGLTLQNKQEFDEIYHLFFNQVVPISQILK